MRRSAAAFLMVMLGSIGGCVERRMVIASDPPGALVLHNGKPIGNAPGDDHFVYYGNHHFTLVRPGYQTLQVDERIRAPWYQFFPLDFITEGLVPLQIEDVRRFTYQMQPLPGVRPEEVSDRATVLRERGKTIGDASATAEPRRNSPPPVPPAAPPPVPPAPPPIIGRQPPGTPGISSPG